MTVLNKKQIALINRLCQEERNLQKKTRIVYDCTLFPAEVGQGGGEAAGSGGVIYSKKLELKHLAKMLKNRKFKKEFRLLIKRHLDQIITKKPLR